MQTDKEKTMKKVYVSSYCVFSSYGSILQSFALKKALISLGFTSSLISWARDNDITRISSHRDFSSLKKIILYFNRKKNKHKIGSHNKKNLAFIRDNIDLIEYNSYDELSKKTFDSNIFIAGSDQVFSPLKCDQVLFLDFVPEGAKKVSYAASMGELNIPREKEGEFRRLLNGFDRLSIREKDAALVAGKYTDKDIEVHIDPTFLIDADEWRKTEKDYPIKGKYILFYPLYWDRALNDQLKELHKRTGLPIVYVGNSIGQYRQKTVSDAGVEQFLWLIDHAEYVITSSFHGAALALNFNKRVAMVVNPNLPSRLNCLSEVLGYPIIPIKKIDSVDIDYGKVNGNIEHEKGRGMAYLKQVLCDE